MLARHHMMYRLFNILVTREEMQLEREQEGIMSERKIFSLNLMVQPFAPKGIQTRKVSVNKGLQLENIKSITSEWIKVYTKTKLGIKCK